MRRRFILVGHLRLGYLPRLSVEFDEIFMYPPHYYRHSIHFRGKNDMIHYFDNCATTKVDDDVLNILNKYHSELYFNPSARSTFSLDIHNRISNSRADIARLLGVNADEIYFTASGTEADNLAILGALKSKRSGNVVVTAAEHSAVYNVITNSLPPSIEIRFAKVTLDGHIDVDDFISKVDAQTLMACFMHVNNETGAINDVRCINAQIKAKNSSVITFSDGVQAVGKIPVNIRNLGVDLYSFSGHKIHCSKGIGCLFVKKGTKISPIVHGGGQESGLRSGTEYVAGCIALSTALKLAVSHIEINSANYLVYKQIIREALTEIPYKELCRDNVSPAIFTLAFADIKGEVLLHMLEQFEIVVGTGSACSSKNKQSRQAKAMGLDNKYVEGILRISFSKYNRKEEVELLADRLVSCAKNLRKTMLLK